MNRRASPLLRGVEEGGVRTPDSRRVRLGLHGRQHAVACEPRDEIHLEVPTTPDLLRLVQELPAGYRAVFNLYALEGYTHAEVAGQLGISEGTSKSQLSKARAVLQRQVAALHSSFSTSYSHAHVA